MTKNPGYAEVKDLWEVGGASVIRKQRRNHNAHRAKESDH